MFSITVFAASSANAPDIYHQTAFELGQALAAKNYRVFYGGGRGGLMRALADGIIENNGEITGVIPVSLLHAVDSRLSENDVKQHLIIAVDIERRKDILMQDSDVIIALPGGVGTFEELYEAVHRGKTVILLGPDQYYKPLLMQHHGRHINFLHATTVSEVMSQLNENISSINVFQEPAEYKHHHDLRNIMNQIHETTSFRCVADETNAFISVMEVSKYNEFQNIQEKKSHSKNKISTAEELFKLAHSIVLFEHDVPLTYAMLHKMITYNQLGFHGKHADDKNVHKRVILFSSTETDFFAPTQQQLHRACEDKLLATIHYSGLIKANNIHEIILAVQEPHLAVEKISWHEKIGS